MTPVRRLLVFIASVLALVAVVGQVPESHTRHVVTDQRTELAVAASGLPQIAVRETGGKTHPLLFVALVLGAITLGTPRRHAASVVVRRESFRLTRVAHCISRRGPPRLLVSN